jgi:hypothetical protein
VRKTVLAAAVLAVTGASLALPATVASADQARPAAPTGDAAAPILLVTLPTSPWEGWYAESVDVHVTAGGGIAVPPPTITSLTYRLTGAASGTGSLPFSGVTGGGDIHVSTPGLTQVTVTAVNSRGEESEVTKTVGVDGQIPRVIFQGKMGTEQPVFELGEEDYFHYACADDFTGVKTCEGPAQGSRIDTTSLGSHEVDVVAVDNVGNGALIIRRYDVVPVGAKDLRFDGAPSVAGTAVVGQRLTATAPAVHGPSGPVAATVGYVWKRDGAPIPGATAASYGLGPADAGHSVSVTVTGAASGYRSAEASSPAVAVVAARPAVTASMKAKGKGRVAITVQVVAAGLDTTGPVTVTRGGKVVGRGVVHGGKVVVTLKKQPRKKVTYVVSFGGGAGLTPAQVKVRGKVR